MFTFVLNFNEPKKKKNASELDTEKNRFDFVIKTHFVFKGKCEFLSQLAPNTTKIKNHADYQRYSQVIFRI